MKRFIKNTLVLMLIVIGGFALISTFDYFFVGNQYECSYCAAAIDKVNRLKRIDSPKIILVGNSNLSFGMDSKMIEEALDMPVVNLGLHGGLGNIFHEEMAKLNINEGDIVIVCHSSFSDEEGIADPALAWMTVEYHSDLWNTIRTKEYPTMLKAYPDYIKNSLFLWILHDGNKDNGGCYARSAFNEYGDVVIKPENEQMNVEEFFSNTDSNSIEVPQIGDAFIERANEFNEYISECGATMLFAGYPVAFGEYSSFDENDFEIFTKELKDKLDCDVISDYTEYLFPYKYFYNTALHLNKEGTEARTQQLIADVKKWQQSNDRKEMHLD